MLFRRYYPVGLMRAALDEGPMTRRPSRRQAAAYFDHGAYKGGMRSKHLHTSSGTDAPAPPNVS